FIGKLRNEDLQVLTRPDEQNLPDRSVELIARSPSASWAMEHTRIESFSQQIYQQRAFHRFLKDLEQRLSGVLPGPGGFRLFFRTDKPVKEAELQKRKAKLIQWIHDTAPKLQIGNEESDKRENSVTEAPPGVHFAVTLTRLPFKQDGCFSCAFYI